MLSKLHSLNLKLCSKQYNKKICFAPDCGATAMQLMARIDECQVANDWNDTTTYANFSLCLKGEANEWLASKVRLLEPYLTSKCSSRLCLVFHPTDMPII